MDTKKEYFVAGITLISVIVILYQYLEKPTGFALNVIYIFDLVVVAILSTDFYFRARESKEGLKFILKHCYEIPAMIPLVIFGIFEGQSVFNIGLRGLGLIRLFRLIQLISRTSYILGRTTNRLIYTAVFSTLAVSSGAVGTNLIFRTDRSLESLNYNDIHSIF